MYVARILYPVKVLGPGKRIGIWFSGCKHHCKGCSNPELWDFHEKYRVSLDIVLDLISRIVENNVVDGFTLTGGDPFEQPKALRLLLPELIKISDDILIYTGYEFDDINANYEDLLSYVSVIIDGKYIESKNNNCILRGSDNQRIIILQDKYQEHYQNYLLHVTNEIQNFTCRDGVISVGIHEPNYIDILDQILMVKGLKKNE